MTLNNRIFSLDLLRGFVMIIMALDHTRDYIHYDAFLNEPLDPSTTTVALYFTRWITNFCAPVFVFLAGTSIYLQSLRKSTAELSGFLFKRGLWLVFIEAFVITFAWTFDFAFNDIILGVIWAIGASMILMALLVRLPFWTVTGIGVLIVAGHNMFDYFTETHAGFWWDMLRNGNFAMHPLSAGRELNFIYPVIPWLGIMMTGYGFGRLYSPSFLPDRRKSILILSGTACVVLFVILRWINAYGDPDPWMVQHSFTATLMSFMDAQKYPPSLMYACVTIGPALLFLAFFERSNGALSRVIQIYGRVPFLYYVLHLFMLHGLCAILFLSRGHSITEAPQDIYGIVFHFVAVGEGYSLKVVYLVWALLVLSLYPICKWFSELKKRNKSWWLSYL
jgi:uncharacterized membrane protein